MAERARLQSRESVTAVGTAEEHRELVAYQLAAALGEDRRSSDQARAVLLADAGREPSHAAVVREHGPAHRCAGGGDRIGPAPGKQTGRKKERGRGVV